MFKAALMGVNFRPASAKEVVDQLKEGDFLALERDPGNEYDSNAVKVIDNDTGEFLGFVAKEIAEELAPLMDAGQEFFAEIIGFLGTRKPHLSILPQAEDDSEGDDPFNADDE